MAERMLDYDGTFFRGQNSNSDPGQVQQGYCWQAINMLNIGGIMSCRPGHRCIVKFPEGKLQGATIFRPKVGLEQLVVAISGLLYVATWPFNSFRQLPNIFMSPFAKQMFWKMTTQSARRLTTDFDSATEVVESREVLFIQDGGFAAPAWYDGSQSAHVRDNAFETPVGSSMEWVGDRLWVAKGNTVFASDIANPFSFREQIYLGGAAGFTFSGDVTAMARTPSLEFPQLLIFTQSTTSIIQANIRSRDDWPTTDNMQREVFQVGCTSQRSVIHHFGRVSWFSPSGTVFFDSASVGKLSARIPIRDNEMVVSKALLHEDLSLVAGGAYGQYELFSVPAEDLFNKHTWVLNNASLESLNDDSGPSWAGHWLGTRPVEWIYGDIAGSERIYHVSTDEDGGNRLWESFIPDRLDNGCPIMWALFTRGHFGQTAQTKKLPGSDCDMLFMDVALIGMEEDLDIGVFYAGGVRGAFKQIMARRLSVEKGNISPGQEITESTDLFAYKAQSRKVRSEDASQKATTDDTGSCPPESETLEHRDESFQFLIVGHGPASVRWIRSFAKTTAEDLSGEGRACTDEVQFNAVRFDGVGAFEDSLPGIADSLSAAPVIQYLSTKTGTVFQDGIAAVGVGSSESIVSQGAADRVAQIIAFKMAEAELNAQLAPILSVGEGFDE